MIINLTVPAALTAQLELTARRLGVTADALASRLLATPLEDLLTPDNIPAEDLAALAGISFPASAD